MSFLIAIPCITAVYLMVGKLGLSRVGFATLGLLLTVAFAGYGLFVPGVDAVIAACITMAMANLCAWFIDAYLMEEVSEEELKQELAVLTTKQRMGSFCSRLTHDFAVCPQDSVFAVGLINNNDWSTLATAIENMTASERQGFYANLNYSSISERALQEVINEHPKDADAHVLMGHVKLCLAKRLGLKPGARFEEPVALAIRQAFKHFNLALRVYPNDAEALCGLLMAKGFTGLSDEHVMNSLEQLLQAEPGHLHGVIAAARFLVLSTRQANEFVTLVETSVDGRSESTVAIARIIAHIECMGLVENGVNNSQVIADVYKQLSSYKKDADSLGKWQRGMSDNVVAYMLQLIGDAKESKHYLDRINGLVSPYPWQINSVA